MYSQLAPYIETKTDHPIELRVPLSHDQAVQPTTANKNQLTICTATRKQFIPTRAVILQCVAQQKSPLLFRLWRDGPEFDRGRFGSDSPSDQESIIVHTQRLMYRKLASRFRIRLSRRLLCRRFVSVIYFAALVFLIFRSFKKVLIGLSNIRS